MKHFSVKLLGRERRAVYAGLRKNHNRENFMPINFGRTGRVLLIDATERSVSAIETGSNAAAFFIGGRGMAGNFLRPFAHLPFDSPQMPLIFMTGPLTGTGTPCSEILSVMSKSPLTRTVFPFSAGGTFGSELKKAGWDGIILTGKSLTPCGIIIEDRAINFGQNHFTPEMNVSQRLACFSTGAAAVTGPAAEHGVLFSSISFSGDTQQGRGGLGLVMETKNIRYIHVRGSGTVNVYDREKLAAAGEDILRLVSASPVLAGEHGFSRYGTGALFDLVNSRRMLPCLNFRTTCYAGTDPLNACAYDRSYATVSHGCAGCDMHCGRKLADGRPVPEYNAMAHLSALTGNSSIERTLLTSALCAEKGMDPVSAASTIACYMEISGKSPDECDIVRLIEDTALSRNEGALLKSGSLRYAAAASKPELSMSVKGLELPAFDPRGAYGTALSYAVSTRGGCYSDACAISHEILRKPVATDRFTFSGKPRMIRLTEDARSATDSLAVCGNIFFAASLEEYARALCAVTGAETTGHDLMLAGERINYNERIMNYLCGFTSADDDLPARFFTDPGTPGAGISMPPIDRNRFLEARGIYYRIRGLSPEGLPLKQKSLELGLSWTDPD